MKFLPSNFFVMINIKIYTWNIFSFCIKVTQQFVYKLYKILFDNQNAIWKWWGQALLLYELNILEIVFISTM